MIFAQDTDYVLLDEPLNNLDIAASRSLMKTLRRMCADHQKMIVTVLHDINVATVQSDASLCNIGLCPNTVRLIDAATA